MNSKFKYYTPIHRHVYHYDNDKSMIEYGKMALMCPECLKMEIVSISHDNMIHKVLNKINDFYADTVYRGTCKRCNEHVEFIQIDANMSQIIEVLNSKGYFTAFSCEGHIEQCTTYPSEYSFACPYIYFYKWHHSEILKDYPLPKTWSISEEDAQLKIFRIYDNIADYALNNNDIPFEVLEEWLETNWNKEKRLKDIYDWALSLPDRDEWEKTSDYDYIKVYGDKILEENKQAMFNGLEN